MADYCTYIITDNKHAICTWGDKKGCIGKEHVLLRREIERVLRENGLCFCVKKLLYGALETVPRHAPLQHFLREMESSNWTRSVEQI